ncbi:MAG: hypothetical protein ACHQ49_05295 [Elusimicrobiota bacterium]
MNASRRRLFDRLMLAGVVLLYAVLAARRIEVPVPGYDEAIYVPPALDILRGATAGHPRGWPLMVMTYVGCPMSYFLAPFIRVCGLSVATMRLPAIGLALAAVLILLYLISRNFPRLPLWAPAGVCLLDSTFLISSRTGLYVDSSIHWFLLSLLLLFLWKWSLTRRPLPALLAFVCVGFGIYAKIIFVWFAFPAAAAVWYYSRRDAPASRARLAGLCGLGLFIGALPLVIYNMTSGWATEAVILDHLIRPDDTTTASNVSFLENLATRWDHLRVMCSGDFLFPTNPARAFSGLVLLALFAAGFFLFRKKRQRASFAGAGAFVAALFFGSVFTVSGRFPQHLFPILPLMLVLGGVALAKLLPGRLPLGLACAALLAPQVAHFNDYIVAIARVPDYHSTRGFYSLSAFLSTAGVARPVALDWGLSHPLLVASGGKVSPRDDFDDPRPSLMPGGTAICYWKPAAVHDVLRGCDRLLLDRSFVVGEIRRFPDPPDVPVFAAIRVLDVR